MGNVMGDAKGLGCCVEVWRCRECGASLAAFALIASNIAFQKALPRELGEKSQQCHLDGLHVPWPVT